MWKNKQAKKKKLSSAMQWMVKRERERDLGVLVDGGIEIGEEIEVQEWKL